MRMAGGHYAVNIMRWLIEIDKFSCIESVSRDLTLSAIAINIFVRRNILFTLHTIFLVALPFGDGNARSRSKLERYFQRRNAPAFTIKKRNRHVSFYVISRQWDSLCARHKATGAISPNARLCMHVYFPNTSLRSRKRLFEAHWISCICEVLYTRCWK